MATNTILLFITVLVSICHQMAGQQLGAIPGRYRNPRITEYFEWYCKNTQCGFEAVCERQTHPCLIPPCPEGPGCVQTPGASMKPGNCPHPDALREGRRRLPECNTDYGCYGTQICCHGYRISRCMRPIWTDYPRKY